MVKLGHNWHFQLLHLLGLLFHTEGILHVDCTDPRLVVVVAAVNPVDILVVIVVAVDTLRIKVVIQSSSLKKLESQYLLECNSVINHFHYNSIFLLPP